jgi:hypothetical protein
MLYSGLAGLTLFALRSEISGQQIFIFKHSFGLCLFAAIIALIGCFLFLIAGGTEQIYLLFTRAGVVCQANTHRTLIPAYLITDALIDGSTSYTPMGDARYTSEIILRTRNGEKTRVYYEILGSTRKNWPISQSDLLAKMNPFIESYMRDSWNYDRASLATAQATATHDDLGL